MQWGTVCIGRQRLQDNLEAMSAAAKAAIEQADVVVVTGGASVGERDFAKAMFEPLGLELIFSKVAIKPGKPAWLGRVGRTLIVGLPGNPTSALATARLFLAPLLAGMSGRPIEVALQWRSVELASDLQPCGARETFHRARRIGETAELLANQDSGAQLALASADLLIRQPPNSNGLKPGAAVQALDF
jgi:molybdopterin molybdotransferase